MKCYYYEECELACADKKKACECEERCKEHKSYNIEAMKYSLKMQGSIVK